MHLVSGKGATQGHSGVSLGSLGPLVPITKAALLLEGSCGYTLGYAAHQPRITALPCCLAGASVFPIPNPRIAHLSPLCVC